MILPARTLAALQLSAASGLVIQDDSLWVVADNVGLLHHYNLRGRLLGTLPLLDRDDADPVPIPKRRKPDFEALVDLGESRLLALASGSRPQRRFAILADLAQASTRRIDLTGLYTRLDRELPMLNIEGAVLHGDQLVLAQRGNGSEGHNALVFLDRETLEAGLARGALDGASLRDVREVELGELEGVSLSFTDLALGPGGALWFSAAAEVTDDPYLDGVCTGSVIGRLDREMRVARSARIEPALKIEGLCLLREDADGADWLAVSDADDPSQPAPLLEIRAPR